MEKAKKMFIIPCTWEMQGEMQIEAETLKQAIEIANNEAPLPTDGEYLDDSFKVDHQSDRLGDVIEENGIPVTEGEAICPQCREKNSFDKWNEETARAEEVEVYEIGHLSVYAGRCENHSYVCPNCGSVINAKNIEIGSFNGDGRNEYV